MAKNVSTLETKMAEVFVDKAPKIPAGGVKVITEWAPWVSLVIGILTLWTAWMLWSWAHVVNTAGAALNSLCNAYAVNAGACAVDSARLTMWVWLALIILAAEGVLYLLAFPGLRDRKKQGWNLLFYAALINLAYAVVSIFSNYSYGGGFIGALIGSAIGFWILFQIRSVYTGKSVDAKA